jgi:uncharacterized protein (TIGR02271 family)
MSDTYDSSRHRDADDQDTTHGSTAYGDDAPAADESSTETVLHEEHLATGTETVESGRVHVRKHVESHPVEYSVPRDIEQVDTSERIAVDEGDSGEVEVLDDGSVSIPVFEEVLVVTKRLVVRERVIVRKHTVVDEYQLQTELRREHVSVDADDSIDVVDQRAGTPSPRDDET